MAGARTAVTLLVISALSALPIYMIFVLKISCYGNENCDWPWLSQLLGSVTDPHGMVILFFNMLSSQSTAPTSGMIAVLVALQATFSGKNIAYWFALTVSVCGIVAGAIVPFLLFDNSGGIAPVLVQNLDLDEAQGRTIRTNISAVVACLTGFVGLLIGIKKDG